MKAFFVGAVALGIVLVGGVGWVSVKQHQQVEQDIINRETGKTVEKVRQVARQKVQAVDFQTENLRDSKKNFDALWSAVQSPEIVRIKVWDKDGRIVWADVDELIGQRPPMSHELEEAVDGEVEVEVEEEVDSENVTESQYGMLAEVYVPILEGDNVIGVVETYHSLGDLSSEAWSVVMKKMIFVAGALLTVYLIVLVLWHRGTSRKQAETSSL